MLRLELLPESLGLPQTRAPLPARFVRHPAPRRARRARPRDSVNWMHQDALDPDSLELFDNHDNKPGGNSSRAITQYWRQLQ